MPRWRKRRKFGCHPPASRFCPAGPPGAPAREPVFLTLEEVEAIRLVDYLGLTQEEAGERMGVSRGTVWRALHSGRRKMARALVEGREIVIVEG